jgi:hypothetical protein
LSGRDDRRGLEVAARRGEGRPARRPSGRPPVPSCARLTAPAPRAPRARGPVGRLSGLTPMTRTATPCCLSLRTRSARASSRAIISRTHRRQRAAPRAGAPPPARPCPAGRPDRGRRGSPRCSPKCARRPAAWKAVDLRAAAKMSTTYSWRASPSATAAPRDRQPLEELLVAAVAGLHVEDQRQAHEVLLLQLADVSSPVRAVEGQWMSLGRSPSRHSRVPKNSQLSPTFEAMGRPPGCFSAAVRHRRRCSQARVARVDQHPLGHLQPARDLEPGPREEPLAACRAGSS